MITRKRSPIKKNVLLIDTLIYRYKKIYNTRRSFGRKVTWHSFVLSLCTFLFCCKVKSKLIALPFAEHFGAFSFSQEKLLWALIALCHFFCIIKIFWVGIFIRRGGFHLPWQHRQFSIYYERKCWQIRRQDHLADERGENFGKYFSWKFQIQKAVFVVWIALCCFG